MFFNELTNEQRRQLTDARQVFQAYRTAQRDQQRRFSGGMRWVSRKGREYLLRKIGSSETSLGGRSPKTEAAYDAFDSGRREIHVRLKTLARRLDDMAPVNTAVGLGRVPKITARIIRKLDEVGLLGRNIFVVGSNALYAYEMSAGILLGADVVATGDVDLLWDTRRGLRLALNEFRKDGILGLIRKVDKSFDVRSPKDFRAINTEGFYVDLICPEDRYFMSSKAPEKLGESTDDIYGAPIGGLEWLINAPKFEETVIGEDGYPLRFCCADPRVFALHKAWVSQNVGRDPVKRARDRDQAKLSAMIAVKYLGLDMMADDLSALPAELRSQAKELMASGEGDQDGGSMPNW